MPETYTGYPTTNLREEVLGEMTSFHFAIKKFINPYLATRCQFVDIGESLPGDMACNLHAIFNYGFVNYNLFESTEKFISKNAFAVFCYWIAIMEMKWLLKDVCEITGLNRSTLQKLFADIDLPNPVGIYLPPHLHEGDNELRFDSQTEAVLYHLLNQIIGISANFIQRNIKTSSTGHSLDFALPSSLIDNHPLRVSLPTGNEYIYIEHHPIRSIPRDTLAEERTRTVKRKIPGSQVMQPFSFPSVNRCLFGARRGDKIFYVYVTLSIGEIVEVLAYLFYQETDKLEQTSAEASNIIEDHNQNRVHHILGNPTDTSPPQPPHGYPASSA